MIKLSLQLDALAPPRELTGAVLSIGRSRVNDLPLGDRKVSRMHARITEEGGRIQIVDLKSGNGTRLNGRKIVQDSLMTGDRIGIGPFELIILNATIDAGIGTEEPLLEAETTQRIELETVPPASGRGRRRPGVRVR